MTNSTKIDITISKAGKTVRQVPGLDLAACAAFTGLTEEAVAYVWNYGWTQITSDAHSTVKKDEEDAHAKALALADKKIAAILDGTIEQLRECP